MSMAFRATRRFVAAIKLARANAARYSATVADPKPSSAGSGRLARPTAVSSAMTKFSGVSEIPHGASITKIRDYIKASNLQGISTTRQFHSKISSESNIQPVPSPLTQIPAVPSKRTEGESSASRKRTVQAVLKRIKQSPKKVNLVAALVRGMRVEDALLQMQVTVKRAAKTVYKVIHSARANATHNHGLDADRLIVAEAFVGKGIFRKTLSYHAKGRCGIRVRPQCRLTVVLRELTPEEEAEIARLRVRKFRKLSKRERQLVPHKLLETKWQWHRTKKDNVVSEATSPPPLTTATKPLIEVCRDYVRERCAREVDECRYAHHAPTPGEGDYAVVCQDYLRGRCGRGSCRYFHVPEHLRSRINYVPVGPSVTISPGQFNSGMDAAYTYPTNFYEQQAVKRTRIDDNAGDNRSRGSASQRYGAPMFQARPKAGARFVPPPVPRSSQVTDQDRLPVCWDFQKNMCSRESCKFVHPEPETEVVDNYVTVCPDFQRGTCSRESCHFYHPSKKSGNQRNEEAVDPISPPPSDVNL